MFKIKRSSGEEDFQFAITHSTVLDKLAASDGPYDVECREIPEFLLPGAMLYAGEKDLLTGSDMIDLLDFLLFAEILIDEIIDTATIVDILKSDEVWTTDRANIVSYIISRISIVDEKNSYDILNTWVNNGNFDPSLVDKVTVMHSRDIRFQNLIELSMDTVTVEQLVKFTLPNLLILRIKSLISSYSELSTANVPVLRGLEVFDVYIPSQPGVSVNLTISDMPKLVIAITIYSGTNDASSITYTGTFPKLREISIIRSNFKFFYAPRLTTISFDAFYRNILTLAAVSNPITCGNIRDVTCRQNRHGLKESDIRLHFPNCTRLTMYDMHVDVGIIKSELTHLSLKYNNSLLDTVSEHESACPMKMNSIYGRMSMHHSICSCPPKKKLIIDIPTLQELTIDHNTIYAIEVKNVAELSRCNVWYRSMADLKLKFLEGIKELKLTIGCTRGDGPDPEVFRNLSPDTNLTFVDERKMPMPITDVYGDRWNEILQTHPYMANLCAKNVTVRPSNRLLFPEKYRVIPRCMYVYYTIRINECIDDFKQLQRNALQFIDAVNLLINMKSDAIQKYKSSSDKPDENDENTIVKNSTYVKRVTSLGNDYNILHRHFVPNSRIYELYVIWIKLCRILANCITIEPLADTIDNDIDNLAYDCQNII